MKNKNKKQVLNDLKEKTNNCLSSRKHANDVVDIIAKIQDEEEAVVLLCIRSVHKLFSHYIEVGELSGHDNDDESKEGKYKKWLGERYKDAINSLVESLLHQHKDIQELALSVLMKFLVKESKFPLVPGTDGKNYFPASLFKKILGTLLSETVNNQALLSRFEEYVAYDDIRYHTLKHIHSLCQQCRDKENNEVLLSNIFAVLENVSVPNVEKGEPLTNFLCQHMGDKDRLSAVTEHRKVYSSTWLEFLRQKLSASLYRKILIMLHEKVMPNLTTPLMLSDFLTQSYNIGGAISLLALNGLFILIQKHNLHYPDFYSKLYALLEPSVFHVKYKARFFYLCDVFLSSTHLPAYLVAAFCKKLAHISLSAPPSGLLVAVPLIYNLILRHPICKQLINRPMMETEYENDPYDAKEPDPSKSRALDSCLWELKTLQYHYHPDVFKMCKKMDVGIPDTEIELTDLYDLTANELYEKEVTKKQKTTATTFEAPTGLFATKNDKVATFWTL